MVVKFANGTGDVLVYIIVSSSHNTGNVILLLFMERYIGNILYRLTEGYEAPAGRRAVEFAWYCTTGHTVHVVFILSFISLATGILEDDGSTVS
jgi:hypothetical protein